MGDLNNSNKKKISFESKLIRSEVTAVKFFKEYILAGIGGFLHVFDSTARTLLYKKQIFEGQKIYEILSSRDHTELLIYGGKNICLLKIYVTDTKSDLKIELLHLSTIQDWIMTAKFVDNDTKIAIVSMHNKTSIWNKNLSLLKEIECDEKCILYSAFICYKNIEDLIILSGTVFSEILIWRPFLTEGNVVTRLKSHKGVIFSIDFHKTNGMICSTSDDRSAILWKIKNGDLLQEINKNSLEIMILAKMYGHFSRIFRCKILSDCLATAGEDGQIILWNFEGKMLKKLESHQPGPIWCLDFEKSLSLLVCGGSDGGISTFGISSEVLQQKLTLPNVETAKFVGFLTSGNIISFSENAVLYFYKIHEKIWQNIAVLNDLKNYAVFQVSLCRNMLALCGFHGQIYIFQENFQELHLLHKYQCTKTSRIFSFHWLTCKFFLTCQTNGELTLFFINNDKILKIETFELPCSKERWSTCACITKNGLIVIGNRKGDIFLYNKGCKSPVDTIKKAHCHLGVVNLHQKDNLVVSLGRNGVFKKFYVIENKLVLMESNKTKYSWLASLEDNFLLAFSGNKFVLSDFDYRRTLFEFDCGGGHRSWSFFKDTTSHKIFFAFINDKVINLIEIDEKDVVPQDFVQGFHSKEINALKIITFENDYHIFISGGEDTTLKINVLENTQDFKNSQSLKVHLSSIRALEVYKLTNTDKNPQEYVIFSGGGRAQIIVWSLVISKANELYMEVVCSEKYNLYEEINQELPEIRIMDLACFEKEGKIILFSGCSDGKIKMFTLGDNKQNFYELNLVKTLFDNYICIMKIQTLKILDKDFLISMATDGKLLFWDITNNMTDNILPFNKHKSGINSVSCKLLSKTEVLILTGGDDNMISLDLYEFKNDKIFKVVSFCDTTTHCAQITGTHITEKYFITSAIDQRIAIFSWKISEGNFSCTFLEKYNTTVADLQGLQCFVTEGGNLNVVVYGKGMEYITVLNYFFFFLFLCLV